MPTTINGIGTHYYGNSNRAIRHGQCQSCGRVGDLASYDTRLWFVVVFVPVIPLGRKRIMDECATCRRHLVADQSTFVAAVQESFDQARQEFAANPTIEAAVSLHGEMLFLHAGDEAAAFREHALPQFHNDAQLHAALAMQLEEAGDLDSAAPLYQRAYTLDSQLPVARDGVARQKMAEGRLDEARSLISFLEQPGAGQKYPLTRLHQLAVAFQQAGRHDEALAIAEHLLRESPESGRHPDFRRFVKTSETALNRFDSVLPSQSRLGGLLNFRSPQYSSGQRWAFFLSVAALLFVITMVAINEYRRQNRTVIVRNEFGPAASVSVDGVPLPAEVQHQLVLSEGTHHISVTGRITHEFDLPVHTDYWQRWSKDPLWIVNVGGASQVMLETAHYAANPRPSDLELCVGEDFVFAPHVDYAFMAAPASLEVKNSSTAEVTKICLSIANELPTDVFQYAILNRSLDNALTYAESRLLIDPANDELLRAYVSAAVDGPQRDRAKSFFQGQLSQRPVIVNWHRYYHELHESAAERVVLIRQYDDFLKSERNDAALLYLRGRLTPSRAEARAFYERSQAADPRFSWPWAALGYQALTSGDWAQCKEFLRQAESRQHQEDVSSILHVARLGLGEGPALEDEYRQKIAAAPPEETLSTLLLLTNAIAARGDGQAAQAALSDWESKFPPDERPTALLDFYRGTLDLMSGDLRAVERRLAAGNETPELTFHYLLASKRPAQAERDASLAEQLQNPWNMLSLSLAHDLGGNANQAQAWRDKTFDAFSQLGFDEVRAAELLHSPDPPSPADLDEVTLLPSQKSLLVAALALRFPQQHRDLAALAKRLAVQPAVYGQLVQQAINHQPR